MAAPSKRVLSDPETRVLELESELTELRAELERSERRVEAMKQIGRVLGSNLELDSLLSEIVHRTTDLLDADRSTLFLADPKTDELWSRIFQGDEVREIRLKQGSGIAGAVLKSGRSIRVADAYKDKRFNQDVDRRSGYRTRCVLACPVRRPQSNEALGVIQVLNRKQGVFQRSDERLLEAIAAEIGVAIEVAMLYSETVDRAKMLEKTHRELRLLLDTERAISLAPDLSEMLETILDTALLAMQAKSAVIYLLNEQGSELQAAAARGVHAASLAKSKLMVRASRVGQVAESGTPSCVNGLTDERRGRVVIHHALMVPIRTRYEGVIGVFELLNRREKGGGFGIHDAVTLEVVAAQAGRAINAEWRRKEREQSERLSAIGRTLSGVMHDLRTPLTLISGYTEIMASADDPEVRRAKAHLVNKQVSLISAMTKELLGFARGERSLLIRKVFVHRFIEELTEPLEREFVGQKIKLSIQLKYKGAAYFDETKLRRVFHNIARNAREAMPGGGEFKIEVKREGDQLVLRFSDRGGGIPQELQGRIFEPFSTQGKVGGTGLGLAMVKQIVDEHGGQISFVSKKTGTTFTIQLPIQP